MSQHTHREQETCQTSAWRGNTGGARRQLADLQGFDAQCAESHEITDEILSMWPNRFTVIDIINLRAASITPQRAIRWNERFVGDDIVALELAGSSDGTAALSPEDTDPWPDRFSGLCIVTLVAAAIGPGLAESYPRRFTGADIDWLDMRGIGADAAASYPSWTTARHIVGAAERQITPAELVDLAGGTWGPQDPSNSEADEVLVRLFGDDRLPVAELDRIRAAPEAPAIRRTWLG